MLSKRERLALLCMRMAGGVFGNGFEHFTLRGSARASEGYRSQPLG